MNWETFTKELRSLERLIESGNYEAVVGIPRGGAIVAGILANHFAITETYCISVRKHGKQRHTTTEITADLRGKSMLLVDDALETGASLIEAKKYLQTLGVANVGTAALYYTTRTQIIPDYSLGEVPQPPRFPWE